jgi:anthranilate synthase/aminodeoxychorismate synthase-like glutamine amidotransferase
VNAKLLLIDNYDSFTYNLVQAFLVLGADVRVYRNDAITIEQAQELEPTHLCISPGPGTPAQAGVSMAMIRAFAGHIPVFGVCLGHQSIVEVLAARSCARSASCMARPRRSSTTASVFSMRSRRASRWGAITR